jgi:hypothetical protein
MRATVEGLLDDARDWSESRSPWARLPLLLYLMYAGVRHLLDPMYRSWFAGLTLVLHELGHLFFSAFGQTLMLLGGSLTQLAAPALVAAYLLFFQRDWFGLSVGVSWLSFSTFELATYVDDANKNQLALVGMGDKVLSELGVARRAREGDRVADVGEAGHVHTSRSKPRPKPACGTVP